MKIDKSVLLSFVLLVLIASLYRIMPARPFGFAPQIAMAIFSGSIIKDKKYAFLLPLSSMLLSDILYQLLYKNGITTIQGFYDGQWLNYLLFAGITVIGFYVRNNKVKSIFSGALLGATAYFVVSNFIDWIGGGLDINNKPYPKTLSGLGTCYSAAIPFYEWSLIATVVFSTILFGAYYLMQQTVTKDKEVVA